MWFFLTGRRCSFVPCVHSLPRAPLRPLTHRRPPSSRAHPLPPLARPLLFTICHYAIRPGFRLVSAFATYVPLMYVGQKLSHCHAKASRVGSSEWDLSRGCSGEEKAGGMKGSRKGCIRDGENEKC